MFRMLQQFKAEQKLAKINLSSPREDIYLPLYEQSTQKKFSIV